MEKKRAQDLWQAQCQMQSIILLKEFIESNANTDMMIKTVKLAEFNMTYFDCLLEYTNFKDDSIEYKCLCCTKNYQLKFDVKLKERFFNTYTFSTHDNIKFILLLRKGVSSYEYMDDSEKLFQFKNF